MNASFNGTVARVSSTRAQGTSTAPTLAHVATPGNFLFALITVNGGASCTAAPGWNATPEGPVVYAGFLSYCAFYFANTTGNERTIGNISASRVFDAPRWMKRAWC